MDDYIKCEDAIKALCDGCICEYICSNTAQYECNSYKAIDNIPAADVKENMQYETICGYDIKELAVFAAACRQEGITESEMHDFCLNARAAVDCVMSEFDRVQKETIERFMNGFMTDMRGMNDV